MKKTKLTTIALAAAGAVGLGCVAASAGSFQNNFSQDPSQVLNFCGTLWDGITTSGTGSANWKSTGGAGAWGATTNGVVYGQTGDGFLQLTFADATCSGNMSSTLCGGVLFEDFDSGLVVAGFTFECDLRIGNGNAEPADGFSINYIRANDPILTALNATPVPDTFPEMNNNISPNGGQFSDNGNNTDYSLMEEGTTTGLSIGFDMWDSGDYVIPPVAPAVGLVAPGLTHDGIGLDIRVDNVLLTTISMPNGTTQGTEDEHGNAITATDPNGNHATNDATAIETGPYDGTGCDTNLAWCHFKTVLDTNGVLNVWWKNTQILTNLQTTFFPSAGRLLMAARVGGNTANIDVDNVSIVTIPASQFVIGPAEATPVGFWIETSDSGSSVVDTNTIQLQLDGANVTPTMVIKNGYLTTTSYVDVATPFAAGSKHVVTLTISDLNKVSKSATRDVVVPAYVNLSSSLAVGAVDTSQPGFNVRSYHVLEQQISSTFLPSPPLTTMETSVRRAEEELFGLLGANDAVGGGTYAEPGVINYSINTNDTAGFGHFNITTDPNNPSHYQETAFPGIAQSAADDPTIDNFACEFTTYIQFPEIGIYTLLFNSDDGFRMTAGLPANDQFNATLITEYDGGRGPSDSSALVYIPKAGYYPFRVVYFQGNGGGDCEWDVAEVMPNPHPLTLVNDTTASWYLPAYRASANSYPAAVTFMDPVVGSGTYQPNITITAAITDGTDGAIKSGSVALLVNGMAVTPTLNKSGSVTKITYTPATLFPPGSNNVAIAFTDASNNTQSNVVPFTVASYTVIPSSMALPASVVDTSKSGFLLMTVKNAPLAATAAAGTTDYGMDNSVYRSELQMHNYTGNPYAAGAINFFGYTNTANVSSITWAFTGPGGYYVEQNVINYNGGTDNEGNYPDSGGNNMPGIPAVADVNDGDKNGEDNYSVEILTVLNLTPGFYTMDVNSDDGFSVSVGNPAEWSTWKLLLGQADYGKGQGDVNFNFYVSKAGYYPFRCLYFEGGGGNEVEWNTWTPYPANNVPILLNDGSAVHSGSSTLLSVAAYQYPLLTSKGSPWVKGYGPAQRRVSEENNGNYTHTGIDAPIWATLEDGDTAVDTSTVKLMVNGVAVTPQVSKSGSETTVTYTNPSPWVVGSTNSVALTFLDRTLNWAFDVENHKNATFFIEAEDFNYGGGQNVAAASTMPYYGGAYAGLAAVAGVDYYPGGDPDDPWYRVGLNPAQPAVISVDMDRGVNELQCNFRLGWIGAGQWYNYTRTFPAGKYNVYGGISNGGTDPDGEYAILQVVDSPSSPTTTNNVGLFDGVGTGSWGYNAHLVPLTDPHGNMVTLNLSGPTTLRYWLPNSSTNEIVVTEQGMLPKDGNGDWDFMLFTPASAPVPRPTLSFKWTGGEFVITYTGNLYQAAAVTGPWSKVATASSPYTVPTTTGAMMYFRAGP